MNNKILPRRYFTSYSVSLSLCLIVATVCRCRATEPIDKSFETGIHDVSLYPAKAAQLTSRLERDCKDAGIEGWEEKTNAIRSYISNIQEVDLSEVLKLNKKEPTSKYLLSLSTLQSNLHGASRVILELALSLSVSKRGSITSERAREIRDIEAFGYENALFCNDSLREAISDAVPQK